MINLGIVLIIMVAFMQSIIGAIVKTVSSSITVSTQLLVYYGVPLLFYMFFIYKDGVKSYKTNLIWIHFIRAFFTVFSVLCFFYVSVHLGLGVAAVLFNTAPVFIPIFAAFILKERVYKSVIISIIISLLGIVIIINPSFKNFINPLTVLGLLSGIFMAISQVMLKFLTNKGESSNKIVFYLYLMCFLISIIFIILGALIANNIFIQTINFSQNIGLLILLLGLISLIAQRILTKAFYYMEPSKVAPFLYLSIPISSLIGFIFFGQAITANFIGGTIFVITGIFIITYIQIKENQIYKQK